MITMASVTFAVLLAILFKSLQEGVFDNLVNNIVRFHTGYIQIHLKGYQDEQVIDNTFEQDSALIRNWKLKTEKTEFLPRLESFALATGSTNTKGCAVIGTNPELENQLTGLKSRISNGQYFSHDDRQALVAEGLAKELNLQTGDTIVLLGQGYQGNSAAGKYRVKGLLKFPAPQLNNSLVYLPLQEAQELYSANGRLTSLVVLSENLKNLEEKASEIAAVTGPAYEVMTWKQLLPDIENHIRADTTFFYIEIGILYVVIAFGMFGTILMMMNERRFETGMLIAIGMKKRMVALSFLAETVLLAFFGTIAGMIISLPVVYYLSIRPIRISGDLAIAYERFGFEPVFPAIVNPAIFITQAIIILTLALTLGLYPFFATLRVDPVKAMKK